MTSDPTWQAQPQPQTTTALLKLARDCRDRGDTAGQAAALDRLLATDQRNIPALIQRADLFAAAGDARSASSFYLMAIRSAPPSGVSREIAVELARAKQACERFALEYQEFLTRNLAAKGFDPSRSSPRFGESLDIILGRKRIFVQQPKYYFFPGLPQVQFDRATSSRGSTTSRRRRRTSAPSCPRTAAAASPISPNGSACRCRRCTSGSAGSSSAA